MALRAGHGPARGFALVEVLVAALLLTLGSLAVAGALLSAWRTLASAATAAQALDHLGDLAESLRAAAPAQRAAVIAAWQQDVGPGAVVTPGDTAGSSAASWVARVPWRGETAGGTVTQWIGLPPP